VGDDSGKTVTFSAAELSSLNFHGGECP
jgi:hypothetical protein